MAGVINREGNPIKASKMLNVLKMTLINNESLKNLMVKATVPIPSSSLIAEGT